MGNKIILHVDMDAFFAAVEQRDNPSLMGKPVVVGADPKGGSGRGVVSTCSYEARKFGIRSAMPISQAYRLCPQAVFLQPHFEKYQQASSKVFKIFYEFTPHIQAISIDEAFLDLTGSCHLFGTPSQAGFKLKQRIRQETGLTASVGIAPVKMVAKIASDLCKPDGLLEVANEGVQTFLHPLSIDKLWGVGPKTAEVLRRQGIYTVGDLAQMALPDLSQKFGEHGEHLFALSRGIDQREVIEDEDIKSVSHEHTFEEDTGNVEEIYTILLGLSEQVSRRLRKYHLKGKTITIKIRLKGFLTYTRMMTLGQRTNFTDVIYETAKDLCSEFLSSGKLIRLVGVRVSNFEDAYVQDGLFIDPEDTRREKIHSVLDQIKDKFGEDAIGRGK